jgi:hypothetical protein
MECSPNDECPVCTMPKTTDQEDNECVADNFCLCSTTATKRNVYIVTEPSSQRYVPVPPELSNVATEIWIVEVAFQFNAKEFGATDCNGGVSGKISAYLKGREYGSY